jgi:hypothetical protein
MDWNEIRTRFDVLNHRGNEVVFCGKSTGYAVFGSDERGWQVHSHETGNIADVVNEVDDEGLPIPFESRDAALEYLARRQGLLG